MAMKVGGYKRTPLVESGEHRAIIAEFYAPGERKKGKYGEYCPAWIVFQLADHRWPPESKYPNQRKELDYMFDEDRGLGKLDAKVPDSKKTGLRLLVEGYLGREFTQPELDQIGKEGFDLEQLHLRCVILTVATNAEGYSEIKRMRPLAKKHHFELEDYTPKAERAVENEDPTTWGDDDEGGAEAPSWEDSADTTAEAEAEVGGGLVI